ncbi:MAG: hypothetical protein M1817_005817 [Caeruleum heppii]|nr:MAG: hypothetical protein M1817_005817 [Caeruleum heppii]
MTRSSTTVGSTAQSSSDDEDYKAVDLISDSDDAEPDVEQAEERNIIESEVDNDDGGGSAALVGPPPPSVASDCWEGFDLDEGLFSADLQFAQLFETQDAHDQLYPTAETDFLDSLDVNTPATSPTITESKRVRFTDELPSSDTSTSDEDDDVFPDLFMEVDQLDPHFRRMIENEQDNDDGNSHSSDGDGSYWDFRGSDDSKGADDASHPTNPRRAAYSDSEGSESGSSVGSSSGYETDEGETTDEDLPPPHSIARTRSVLRRPSTSSIDMDEDDSPATLRRSLHQASFRRIGPALGSWIADPTKPIAIIDSSGKRLIIYPPQTPSRKDSDLSGSMASSGASTVNNSPQTPQANLVPYAPANTQDLTRALHHSQGPLSGSAANLMMGGLLHGAPGNEYLLGGQIIGPPEAFYPWRSVDANGELEHEIDDDDADDDDEEMLNVADFIDFGDDSSEDDDDTPRHSMSTAKSTPTGAAPSQSASDTQSQQNGSTDDTTQNMLHHFDRGVVTAFRRNQARHKYLISRPSLPSRDTLGSGFLSNRAIKGGRFAAANSPISPKRKRKSSFGSLPLAGNVRNKVISGHTRRRSGLI